MITYVAIEQALIFVLTMVTVILVNRDSLNLRRLAPITGLLCQPFWIHASYGAEQYGNFLTAVCFTFIWGFELIRNYKNGWYSLKDTN